jgi:hypothetical protein
LHCTGQLWKLLMNDTGKPYAGKPHVRFDEGAGAAITPLPLYSTDIHFCYDSKSTKGSRKARKKKVKTMIPSWNLCETNNYAEFHEGLTEFHEGGKNKKLAISLTG